MGFLGIADPARTGGGENGQRSDGRGRRIIDVKLCCSNEGRCSRRGGMRSSLNKFSSILLKRDFSREGCVEHQSVDNSFSCCNDREGTLSSPEAQM